jgi:hypothetical protein
MKDAITKVYAGFTIAVVVIAITSVYLAVALEDDHLMMYAGLAGFGWMMVTIVVAPIMMHVTRVPVQRNVPIPRWRQRYNVNHEYDDGYRRRQGYHDYYDDDDGYY